MNKKGKKNRAAVLFAICCNTFCLGSVYAWSAFSGELAAYMGWEYSQVTMAYSIMLVAIAAMGLLGGVLLQRFGAKKLIRLAGLMWGLGWFLTGCSTSIPMLYLTFGILAGSASGFGYTPGVVTAVGWYPDKKGFASGMAVGVCGMASLVIAPLANFLLNVFNVMTAFKIMGILFLILMLSTSWYIGTPPAAPASSGQGEARGMTWKEVLKDPRCYILWLVLMGASVSGLMITGHASRIGQEMVGITASQAALLVGIMAAANFIGRLVLGSLSDKVGRHQIVIGSMIVCAIDMVVLSKVQSFIPFVLAIVVVGMCFGGVLATFSAISSDTFGAKYNGINYSIIFTGYGIAAVIGPTAATSIRAASGSYSSAFLFAGVCSVIAAVLCAVVMVIKKQKKEKNYA